MNITKAEIYKIYLPLKEPFRVSFTSMTHREIVFLKLFDKKGLVGIGETSNFDYPFYEPDFNDGTIFLLQKYLIPQILNKEINTVEELESVYKSMRGNNFTKQVLESAFWHLKSQETEKPLRTLWGGVKETIPAAISIGMGRDLNDTIERVLRYIENFQPKRAKLKIKPGIDVKLIEAVRKKYPDLPIMVDANSAYTLNDLETFKTLDKFNLLMIEQPLTFTDIVDHATLQKQITTPVCLDESASSYSMAEQALKLGSCKIINIKPQRVGGYWQAKRVSELAAKYNVAVWCGGMIESGWGQLFNCAIATLPNFTYDNDICLKKWYFADDVLVRDIPEKDGIINVAELDNYFEIDEKKFKKYTVSKVEIK